MANVQGAAMRRWSIIQFFSTFVWSYRYRKAKAVCDRCAVCGRDVAAEVTQLLRDGHLRAAVFSARLQLELTLQAIVDDIGNAEGQQLPALNKNCHENYVRYLRQFNYIDRPTGRRIRNVYTRASRIVHGGAVTHYRARSIACEVRELLEDLDGAKSPALLHEPKEPKDRTFKRKPRVGLGATAAVAKPDPLATFQIVNEVADDEDDSRERWRDRTSDDQLLALELTGRSD